LKNGNPAFTFRRNWEGKGYSFFYSQGKIDLKRLTHIGKHRNISPWNRICYPSVILERQTLEKFYREKT